MEGFFFTTSHPQPLRRRPWKPLPDQWRQNNPRWKIPRHRHLAGRFLFSLQRRWMKMGGRGRRHSWKKKRVGREERGEKPNQVQVWLGLEYNFRSLFLNTWVAVEIMFMGNWPCPNWVVPYRLWRFWISWVLTIWNDQGFRSRSIVMECWSLINPGLLADRVFSLACPGFALRATSFNSGPCVDVSSRCWHSWRMPACSSFVLLLYLPIQKCETGETFNNSLVNFLGPKLQHEIESGLSKCGACPSASMKPYMKGIGRYRLGYRLRTPAFSPESVSGHSLQ